MNLFKLFILLGISFTVCSCGGGGGGGGADAPTQPVSNVSKLTKSPWRETEVIITTDYTLKNLSKASDLYSIMASCDCDDLLKFDSSGTASFSEGTSKCNPSDPDIYLNESWSLNGSTLVIGTTSYEIIELSDTKLKITTNITANGTQHVLTETYILN